MKEKMFNRGLSRGNTIYDENGRIEDRFSQLTEKNENGEEPYIDRKPSISAIFDNIMTDFRKFYDVADFRQIKKVLYFGDYFGKSGRGLALNYAASEVRAQVDTINNAFKGKHAPRLNKGFINSAKSSVSETIYCITPDALAEDETFFLDLKGYDKANIHIVEQEQEQNVQQAVHDIEPDLILVDMTETDVLTAMRRLSGIGDTLRAMHREAKCLIISYPNMYTDSDDEALNGMRDEFLNKNHIEGIYMYATRYDNEERYIRDSEGFRDIVIPCVVNPVCCTVLALGDCYPLNNRRMIKECIDTIEEDIRKDCKVDELMIEYSTKHFYHLSWNVTYFHSLIWLGCCFDKDTHELVRNGKTYDDVKRNNERGNKKGNDIITYYNGH